MSTSLMLSPIDTAVQDLSNARSALAETHAAKARIASRLAAVTEELEAAERASVAAASTESPDDDADAIRRLADARQRLDVNAKAVEKNDAAIARAEELVAACVKSEATARAEHELEKAVAIVPAFEKALAGLVDSVAAIEAHATSARRHASSAGIPLNVPIVLGRRLGHVFQAANIAVTTDGTPVGPNASDAARAVRDAIENPRWSNF